MNAYQDTFVHPSREELASFALGKPTPNAETIAEHLALCTRCETFIANTPRDTFVGLIAKGRPGQSLTGSYVPGGTEPTDDELPDELRQQTKYIFIRKLGGGGMGVVWLAEHALMKRKVAVKLIPPSALKKPELRERFLQEIVAAARLEHPHVVRAYAAEEFGPHMIFEMEYVDGKDLHGVVQKKGPLPITNCIHYIMQAAKGLQEASLKGLIHRDIKPHNLMLTRAGTVKVADFGLAKFGQEADKSQDRSLTGVNAMMGTPHYMAPEQARNAKSADIRADIYSLGCTFYYLLTGKPPFEGGSLSDLIFKHWEDERPDVRKFREDVPAELSEYVRKMMAIKAEDRPQTPKEIVDGLAKFARSEPVPKEADPSRETPALVELAPAPLPVKKKGGIAKWIAGALAAVTLLAGGIVYQIKTRDGTLVIETDIPNPTIKVDGETVRVESQDGSKKYIVRLKKGREYTVSIEKDGVEAAGQKVTLHEGTTTIEAMWVNEAKEWMANRDPVLPGKVPGGDGDLRSLPAKPAPPPLAVQDSDADVKNSSLSFVPLFNGRDLKGWNNVGTVGKFSVKENLLVGLGTKVFHGGGAVLETEEVYRDFRLRIKFRQASAAACKVSVRGTDLPSGHFSGYGVLIGGSPGAGNRYFCGSISLAKNLRPQGAADPVAKSAVETNVADGEWHMLEVEVVGGRIRTFVDSAAAANHFFSADNLFPKGRVRLSVPSRAELQYQSIEIAEITAGNRKAP